MNIHIGDRFGSFVITRFIGGFKRSRQWECTCDCGHVLAYEEYKLKSHGACRCATAKSNSICKRRHGLANTRIYTIWAMMKQRCLNPRAIGYERYGGRGIKICESWLDIVNFFRDMGYPPSDYHSLDRIDNTGNYTPENCRWSTKKEQNRNQKTNRMIEHMGETRCLAEWCEILGIDYNSTQARIRRGISVEMAFLGRKLLRHERRKRRTGSITRNELSSE